MIPIYRAKKIYSDEYIIGNIITIQNINYIQYEIEDKYDLLSFENGDLEFDDICEIYPIDQSTLEISFDNGKSFIKTSGLEVKTCVTYDLVYICEKNRQHREKQMGTGKIYTIITDKGF